MKMLGLKGVWWLTGIRYYDTRIYRYGSKYKIIYLKKFQASELHIPIEFEKEKPDEYGKLHNNISRARSKILSLGMCNEWDYFTTFTLDQQKYDRFNLEKWQKDFSQWIRNYRKKTGYPFKYLLIPEHHLKDYAWHMHGLIKGIPWDILLKFDPAIHPIKLVTKGYRYHEDILNKFGYNSFGKIKNKDATTKYLMKYITKTMAESNLGLGSHLYYASKGLLQPELVANLYITNFITKIEYENDYMASAWISGKEMNELGINITN